MTESQFIKDNIKDWEELERILHSSNRDPDRLQKLFVKISSDLSYASTFYPNRSVRLYLNKLTQQIFDSVEKNSNKKNDFSGIKDFFKYILPLEMYRSRKAFLLSFLVFVGAVIIGIVSTANSDDFTNLILGSDYVAMTESNINKGDPMAVYKDEDMTDMFFGITINNIRVSFYAFVGGVFGGLGTLILLLYNGIMVGTFQYFFYKKGLLATSFFTIWIHGTIEISAIIIAGAAGFVLGSGLLFPGTYSRAVSLQVTAKRAVRIIVGIMPLFILAGFLESFVTRLTDMPLVFKAFIILASLALILGMYVFYPYWVHKNHGDKFDYDIRPVGTPTELDLSDRKMEYGEMLGMTFSLYRQAGAQYFGYLFKYIVPLFGAAFAIYIVYFLKMEEFNLLDYVLFNVDRTGVPMFGLYWLATAFMLVVIIMLFSESEVTLKLVGVYLKKLLFKSLLLVAAPMAAFYFGEWWYIFGVFLFLPPQYIFCRLYEDSRDNAMAKIYNITFSIYGYVVVHLVILGMLHLLLFSLLNSGIFGLFYDYIQWHDVFSVPNGSMVFSTSMLYIIINFAMLPLYVYACIFSYKSYVANTFATDLQYRYTQFGLESNIFENR